jgi:hypothetical protein
MFHFNHLWTLAAAFCAGVGASLLLGGCAGEPSHPQRATSESAENPLPLAVPPSPGAPTATTAPAGKRASVSAIAFTGPGLTGEVSVDHWNDLNGNDVEDPGEPPGDTVILPPEWVGATGRNKPGIFHTDKPLRVRVTFVLTPDLGAREVVVSATCPLHSELALRGVGPLTHVRTTDVWEGIFETARPIETINAFEDFYWQWTIRVNGKESFQDATRMKGVYVLP